MTALWSNAEVDFRDEVREFCSTQLPRDISDKVLHGQPLQRDDYMRWQDILASRGWLAGFWPKDYGGQEWGASESYIFQEETARAGAPWLLPFGVNYAGPVIFTFGNEEQKRRHLPGIVDNSVFWCQGYSEPGAGSDLARLSTKARRDGDAYVVNGSKIWTSMAQWADMMFCLVRTNSDARLQQGISFLLIDMNTPGINVQPIQSIDGFRHLNQVFFDDVRVPATNLVGEENKGWTYAKFLLGHERVLSAETGKARRLLARAESAAQARGLGKDWRIRDKIARFEVDIHALEWMSLRLLADVTAGAAPGTESSLLKIRGSSLLQEISEFSVDVLGPDALAYDPQMLSDGTGIDEELRSMGIVHDFLFQRAPTIWGGSNEIQRNIIAKHALGLPTTRV
ncbi:Acyl-CoA dehydrogenase [Salinihabitans flavidus]|uniref:Acyl-CoA dehydrogenase n=1 Tax=Salinihabitans flavidus TaxID=569882 RepID=A0A1H8RLZ1_9RHOB|nr:acyl-CoA dehydrogenase family protein [Salinihabitans flavidus]SEO67287.1 Acyl-CoA dehydrogenase [Salinihabitans flavidus]